MRIELGDAGKNSLIWYNEADTNDNGAEVARLVEQERAIAWALGGLLPEHGTNQAAFVEPMQRVLDVACGSGAWVIDMALAYPHLQVMGIDSSANMIDYARTQAQVGRLENASFTVMDACLPLDYPDNFFDLVSGRWLSVIGQSAWPAVLQELFRVTRPGGFIRLIETEDFSVTTSPAYEKKMVHFLQALQRANLSFSPSGRSIGTAPKLPYLLRNAGYRTIVKHASILDWSAGTDTHAAMATNVNIFFQLLAPFIASMRTVTEEELYLLHRQGEMELYTDDFCAFLTFYFIGAQKPCK